MSKTRPPYPAAFRQQRIPDTPVVDGRQFVVGAPTDGNAVRWNAMLPEAADEQACGLSVHAAARVR